MNKNDIFEANKRKSVFKEAIKKQINSTIEINYFNNYCIYKKMSFAKIICMRKLKIKSNIKEYVISNFNLK